MFLNVPQLFFFFYVPGKSIFPTFQLERKTVCLIPGQLPETHTHIQAQETLVTAGGSCLF